MKKISTNSHKQEKRTSTSHHHVDAFQESLDNQNLTDVMKFLDIQEHTDEYSDEELEELFKDDDLKRDLESAACLKQSFSSSDSDDMDVSAEWQAFAKKHYRPAHQWRKIAAISIGVIITSGIIFAAVSLHRPRTEQTSALITDSAKVQKEQEKATSLTNSSKSDSTTIKTSEPTEVFDNVELESILNAMSQYYGKKVEYKSDAARHLHFHYEWNKRLSLEQNITVLNSFEHVDIVLEQDKIVVE